MSAEYEVRTNAVGSKKVLYRCPKCRCQLESSLKAANTQDKCPQCSEPYVVPGLDAVKQEEAEKARRQKEAQLNRHLRREAREKRREFKKERKQATRRVREKAAKPMTTRAAARPAGSANQPAGPAPTGVDGAQTLALQTLASEAQEAGGRQTRQPPTPPVATHKERAQGDETPKPPQVPGTSTRLANERSFRRHTPVSQTEKGFEVLGVFCVVVGILGASAFVAFGLHANKPELFAGALISAVSGFLAAMPYFATRLILRYLRSIMDAVGGGE